MNTATSAWYVANEGQPPSGPFSAAQVVEALHAGRLDPSALCWCDGAPHWLPLAQVEPFQTALAPPRVSWKVPVMLGGAAVALLVPCSLALWLGGRTPPAHVLQPGVVAGSVGGAVSRWGAVSSGARKAAEIRVAKMQINMFLSALEHYASDIKCYPTTEQGLAALTCKPSDLAPSVFYREGGYLSNEIPKDPWGRDYHYEYPPTHGTGDRPDVWSDGPDGVEGTDDDVASWTRN